MENTSVQFASFWQRLAARIIDGLVLSVLSTVLFFMSRTDASVPYGEQESVYTKLEVFVSISNFLLFYLLYYPFFEVNGGTIGKRVLSIATVSMATMQTISLGQAYKRSFVLIWPVFALVALMYLSSSLHNYFERTSNFLIAMLFVFAVVGPLAMIWSSRNQGWHDAWTGTLVIKSGKSRKRRSLEELDGE